MILGAKTRSVAEISSIGAEEAFFSASFTLGHESPPQHRWEEGSVYKYKFKEVFLWEQLQPASAGRNHCAPRSHPQIHFSFHQVVSLALPVLIRLLVHSMKYVRR